MISLIHLTQLLINPGLVSFLISLAVSPLVIWIYTQKKWLDDPSTNSHIKVTHSKPTPRGGGIPIYLSLLLTTWLTLGFDKHLYGIMLGATVLVLVGIADDIFDLNPYLRLFTGIIAGLCVVGAGIGIAYITNPLGSPGSVIHLNQPQIQLHFLGETHSIWIIADLFALVWILWTANIINWSKGLDGQMPGFVSLAAIFIGLLSYRFASDYTQWPVIQLAAITAGSYLGFLVWNFFPQTIMPGYGGGSLAGFLLAVLSILSGAKIAALVLILTIPMADAVYTIFRRLLRGKSPVWGDRGHLHHRLLDVGWTKPQIAYFYWFITFVLGIATLFLNSTQKLYTIAMFTFLTGAVIIWLKFIRTQINPHL